MFKRNLQQPLMILWATIIVVRAAFDQLLLHKPGAGSWFDLLSAMLVLAVPVAEFGVFYRAYRAYSNSAMPEQAGKFGFLAKILLPLFFFCLPYGLWNSRRMIVDMVQSVPGGRWIEIGGLAASCGFNLVLSGMAVHSMLTAHFRAA